MAAYFSCFSLEPIISTEAIKLHNWRGLAGCVDINRGVLKHGNQRP